MTTKHQYPSFLELTHIVPPVDELIAGYNKLKTREKSESDMRFSSIRPALSAAFPFASNGYDYVAVTDIREDLKHTVVTASPSAMYKLAMRGQAPAMDDRNYTQIKDDVPESLVKFLSQFRGQVARCRFATLKSRQTIYQHIDTALDHTVRVHVPLITDKFNLFGIVDATGNVTVRHLEVGKVYFVNTALQHFVINSSRDTDRTHLVVNLNSMEDIKEAELTN